LKEASGRGGALDVVNGFIDGMLAAGAPEFASLSEPAFLRPEQRDTILGLYQGLRSSLAKILHDGAARGELRTCAEGIVAQTIIGVVSWVPMARRWRTSDPLSDQDLVLAIKALLAEGVAADRSESAAYTPLVIMPPQTLQVGHVFDSNAMASARREALLAAASWLFNLKGIDATSLDEIAERVAVTKKVIYHNVNNKNALVAECYRRSFRFYENIAQHMQACDGSRVDALCASYDAQAEASLREDIAPLAPLGGFDALPDSAREEIQESSLRLMDAYLDTYRRGEAEGSLRHLHARAVLAISPGLFEWLPKWFDSMDAAERAAAPGELARLLRIGLLAV